MKTAAAFLSILLFVSSLSAQGINADDSKPPVEKMDVPLDNGNGNKSSIGGGSSLIDEFSLFWGITYTDPVEKTEFIRGYCNENIKPCWQVGDICLFFRRGYIQAGINTGFLLSFLHGDSYGYESSTYYVYYEFEPSFMVHAGLSLSACFPVSEYFSLFGGIGGKTGFIEYNVRKNSDSNTLDTGLKRDYRKYFNDAYMTCGIMITPFAGSGLSFLAGYDRSLYSDFVKTGCFRLSLGWRF